MSIKPAKQRSAAEQTQPKRRARSVYVEGVVDVGTEKSVDLTTGRVYTAADVQKIASELLRTPMRDLRVLMNAQTTEGLKAWIAGLIVFGAQRGDVLSLDVLLNRVIGKAPDKLELTGKDGDPIKTANATMLALIRDPKTAKMIDALDKKTLELVGE